MPPPTPLYGDPEVGDELQALMVEAIQQASGQDCGHVVDRASLCVRCPADGLRCLACAQRHYQHDHELAWRFTCDRCGDKDRDLHQVVASAITLVNHRLVAVALDGLGLCPACARLAAVGRGGGVG